MEASGVEGRKNLRLVFRDQSLLQPSPTQTSSAANAARPSQSMDIRACSTRYQKGQAKPTSGYCTGHQLSTSARAFAQPQFPPPAKTRTQKTLAPWCSLAKAEHASLNTFFFDTVHFPPFKFQTWGETV